MEAASTGFLKRNSNVSKGKTSTYSESEKAPATKGTKGTNPLISEHCVGYLNYRIEQEDYSSRIYLSMSLWLNNEGYTGAAALWKKYSDEEMTHADWSRNYLLAFGIQPLTAKLEEPIQEFSDLTDIIYKSFDHEITVSEQIKDMADQSLKRGDHMLYELCLKYMKEQVEEHDKMQTWVDKLKTFGTDKIALRLLDNEMGGK